MQNRDAWKGLKCQSCIAISDEQKFDQYSTSEYRGEDLSGRRIWICGKCVFDEKDQAAKTLKEVMVGQHGIFKNLKIGQG